MPVRIVVVMLSMTIVSACASSVPSRDNALAEGTRGETVQSVCFTRQINSWYPLSDEAIIVQRGLDEYFRLQLIGLCEPDEAFSSVNLRTRSGACVSPGDQIEIPGDYAPECTIQRIDSWIPLASGS